MPRNPAGAVTAYAQYLDPGGDLISTTNTERVIKSFFAGGMHMKKESEEAYRAQPIAFIQE